MDNYGLKKIWKKDGHDFIADIGNMKKAVVVAMYLGGRYGISPRSYFPFDDNDYEKRFDNYLDACKFSEEYIKKWIESIFNKTEKEVLVDNPYNNLKLK